MTDLPSSLVAHRKFQRPTTQTTNQIKSGARRLWAKIIAAEEGESDLVPDELSNVEGSLFDETVWAILETSVFDMLDDCYATWLKETAPKHRVCACLALPSVPPDIFSRWAEARGHDIWQGPSDKAQVLPSFDPMLHRSMDGLEKLRDVTARLNDPGGPVLICGTTVQWRFLERTSDIDLVASDVRQLPAFNGLQLAQLIRDYSTSTLNSRQSGKDILAIEDDELEDSYLRDLAALTIGCPWSALHLLDQSVTRAPEEADDDATWVGRPEFPEIEDRHRRPALFLLHCVLLHRSVVEADIANLIPIRLPDGLLPSLVRTNLLQDNGDGRVVINRTYAPHIRRLLSEAGFPLDRV